MNKYKYMQIYTLALMDIVRWIGEKVIYNNETGELMIMNKTGGQIYYRKINMPDYDSCALLLKEYILSKMSHITTFGFL